jgi:hypothetical protein
VTTDSPLYGMACGTEPQTTHMVLHSGLKSVVAHFRDKSNARGFYLAMCFAIEAWPNVDSLVKSQEGFQTDHFSRSEGRR